MAIIGGAAVASQTDDGADEVLAQGCAPGSGRAVAVNDVHIKALAIDATVQQSYTTTRITQVVTNPTSQLQEQRVVFQIPDEAYISHLEMIVSGTTYVGEVILKEVAEQRYDEAKAKGEFASIVSARDHSTFEQLVSVPPGEDLVVSLHYEEFLATSKKDA